MVNTCHHPWTVTAPWYEWARAGVPSSGRQTRPLIQKFASDNFIADFIKEPQRSLAFDARDDELYTAQFVSAAPGQFVRQAGRAVPGEGRGGHALQPGRRHRQPAQEPARGHRAAQALPAGARTPLPGGV
jgi:hypothetical protein